MTAAAPEPFVYVTDPATIRGFLEGDIDVPALRNAALARVVVSADQLRDDLSAKTKAVERALDLVQVWESTEPQGLMSRRRAAAILREVLDQ
jgi:hypothetical protein